MTWGEMKKQCKDVPDNAVLKYGHYSEEFVQQHDFVACSVEITKDYTADPDLTEWYIKLK